MKTYYNGPRKGMMYGGGATMRKPMMYGGMASGKKHMYSAGGSVTDNLPNKGLHKLAQTSKGRDAVKNMGFDV